ncbi:OmpA family protein [Galbibacter mesophilus]|uniref:OmpA family protein n=1 Tax=Galbibacter mesophilus TaxID=379069 RepID=UPI00191F5942|nr:OmpA family protein [Galbibacter mesophilus]MCM5663081.1 OmpA family protein [Galbibacter mesophilus]
MNRYLVIIVSLSFFLNFPCVFSQERLEKKGDKAFDKYAFINAREYYLKVANEEEEPSDELLKKLGDSYYYTGDYINAANWYRKLYNKDTAIPAEYLYRYALSLKSTGDYAYSDKIMGEFYDAKGNDYRARLFDENRDYLNEIELQSGKFSMEKVDFNSPLSDFAPTFYNNGILFASNRIRPKMEKSVHAWNDQPFLDLYFVSSDSTSEKIELFSKKINTKFHESTAAYVDSLNTLYFTRNNYYKNQYGEDEEGVNRLKLFKAVKTENEDWKVEELPFNSDSFSVAHPTVSPHGEYLYFSSDMPGGYGQSDLYRVKINGNGFGTPENLGKEINTEGRETFPFLSSDNQLFFSSDGHVGLGGLDVFVAQIGEGDYVGPAYNVGRPINGKQDDFTFILSNDTKRGYMASNRGNHPSNDDIYKIEQIGDLIVACFQLLKGNVLDYSTKKSIAGVEVSLLNAKNEVIETVYSDDLGNFSFKEQLSCMQSYTIRTSMRHYENVEKNVATGNLPSKVIEETLLLKKGDFVTGTDLGKVIKLNPIYFDFDKWNIRQDAEIELKKVIEAMQIFPELKIDVRSHTDSRAPADYNSWLSEKRNQATIQYIIDAGGIAPQRLSGRGYGEEQPVNHCTDGVACNEKEHQLNRRSEFVILKR